MKKSRISLLAKLALVTATLIWGSSFVVMKNTLDAVPSFYLLAIRFTIGAAALAIIFFKRLGELDVSYLVGGGIMGFLLFGAYALQTVGLNYTTPGKNAFLTTVYCIIVPFLTWALTKERPPLQTLIAAAVCVAGVWLVSVNPAAEGGVNKGDMLTLGGGFMFALHILAVTHYSRGRDIIALTVIQFASSAALAWVFGLIFENFPPSFGAGAVTSLAYLGLAATAAALLLQNIGQKYTPPSTAALLLSLEAVFGAVFSILAGSERLSPQLICGFVLIFGALVLSEAKPPHNNKEFTM